jgi:hypothetical protein
MRVLHAIKPHETFVASGIYQSRENGSATGTTEQWSIHQLPDGAHLIRVDHNAREERGLTVLVEALTLPGHVGRFERFDTHLITVSRQPFQKIRKTTTFTGDSVLIGTAVDGSDMTYRETTFTPGTLVYPPGHVFAGALLQQLVRLELPVPVFSWLNAALEQDAAIAQVQVMGITDAANLTLGGREFALDCFMLEGSNPALSGVFCLNEAGILMRRAQSDEGGLERVTMLTEYAHR